jgi:hypothetical protein
MSALLSLLSCAPDSPAPDSPGESQRSPATPDGFRALIASSPELRDCFVVSDPEFIGDPAVIELRVNPPDDFTLDSPSVPPVPEGGDGGPWADNPAYCLAARWPLDRRFQPVTEPVTFRVEFPLRRYSDE